MSPQAALANQASSPSPLPIGCPPIACPAGDDGFERTRAARIIFDRLPIEELPAFPVGRPLRSDGSLRLVPSVAGPDRSLPREIAAPAQRVRLTARGRVVAVAVALVLFAAIAGVLHLVVGGSAAVATPAPAVHASIVVQPGDSLWSIATTFAPKADPRATVARIVDLNGIVGSSVYAGEQLQLP